jgi:hypothetical protein
MTRLAILASFLIPLAGCPTDPGPACDDPDGCGPTPPPDAMSTPHPVCGNTICDTGETTATCAQDCPPPGPTCNNNNICETTETVASCPADCASTVKFANYASVPVWFLYAWPCGTTDMGADLLGNNTLPNGYVYTINDANPGCWNFYAKNQGGGYVDSYYGANVVERQTYTWNIY